MPEELSSIIDFVIGISELIDDDPKGQRRYYEQKGIVKRNEELRNFYSMVYTMNTLLAKGKKCDYINL